QVKLLYIGQIQWGVYGVEHHLPPMLELDNAVDIIYAFPLNADALDNCLCLRKRHADTFQVGGLPNVINKISFSPEDILFPAHRIFFFVHIISSIKKYTEYQKRKQELKSKLSCYFVFCTLN